MSASENNTIDYSEMKKKSPIICKVRHTISTTKPAIISLSCVIKFSLIVSFSLLSIIGSIAACIKSLRVEPSIPIPISGPVNGQWCSWLSWSRCSLNCSSSTRKYGLMTRIRYCNCPLPQMNGKNCSGISEESTTCFNTQCPIPVDGQWSSWSMWSACGKSCKRSDSAPLQSRSRTCSNPVMKNGGKLCEGESTNQHFCDSLPQCQDSEWGGWTIAGPCESRDTKSCAPGTQRYKRMCNIPASSSTSKDCEGTKEKIEDCWFSIGCPVDLQAPLNVQVTGNKTGLFNVSWSSVPYGVPAVSYTLYETIEDETGKQVNTISEVINAIPHQKITSQHYWKIIDLRKFMIFNWFKTLAIRMGSVDFRGKESVLSIAVRSQSKAVDGEWSSWGHWSECSVTCNNQRGQRLRYRDCNNPSPSDGGKFCIGVGHESLSCFGISNSC